MESISTLIACTVLFFVALTNGEENGKLQLTPVKVVGVKNGINNSYLAAVKDNSSTTGWAVQVETNLTRYEIDTRLLVYMFDKTPQKGTQTTQLKSHYFFGTFLCDLLISDSRFDQWPQHNNFPRDVINLIFPGQQGSCNLTEGTKSILSSAKLNTAKYENPMVRFPNSSYFELYVNVLSQDIRDDLENNYLFQVKLIVGNPPKTGRYCFDTEWNYYIIWRICTIAEFFESAISGFGWKILHIF